MMKTSRIFFAIVPPKETQLQLSHILKELQGVLPEHSIRWQPVEKLHITLRYLGPVPQESLSELVTHVQLAVKNISAFQLGFGDLEWFPSIHHPRVLSLSVIPHDILSGLSNAIGQALIRLNYPIESRPFRGHMSMGRLIKHGVQNELVTRLNLQPVTPIMVDTIYMMESRSEKEGSAYHQWAEIDLG